MAVKLHTKKEGRDSEGEDQFAERCDLSSFNKLVNDDSEGNEYECKLSKINMTYWSTILLLGQTCLALFYVCVGGGGGL